MNESKEDFNFKQGLKQQRPLHKWSAYFDLPNPGLRAYFERVVAGQPDEYRTPFYEGLDLQDVADRWDRILKEVRTTWPTLYEYESDQREKIGPMSVMQPLSKRMTDIDSYYDLISLKSEPITNGALDLVVNEWRGVRDLKLRSAAHTLERMKLSTNSGSPFFEKRSEIRDAYGIPKILTTGNPGVSVTLTEKGQFLNTAILGWRGQEGGPKDVDVKQRVVWMFPFAVNLEELRFYQPLIELAQHAELVPAWVSNELVDAKITRLLDSKASSDYVVCTDFSKFDQHFNSQMQAAAKYIISHLAPDCGEWIEEIFPIKYSIPLAYNWGKIRTGAHGMASGSGGTNADETLAHRALQYQAALDAGATLNPFSQCLGDDGILSYPGIDVDDVMMTYEAIGQEMNPTKQYVSKQECIYLRRWHNAKYRPNGMCAGVYPTMRALGRLCEQERFYENWSKEMVALRQLSILENCQWHPLRERFADFCMKGDKFRLGLDIPGFLDNIESKAQGAIENMPDFLGYVRSLQGHPSRGINDWWIVKYLKSKA